MKDGVSWWKSPRRLPLRRLFLFAVLVGLLLVLHYDFTVTQLEKEKKQPSSGVEELTTEGDTPRLFEPTFHPKNTKALCNSAFRNCDQDSSKSLERKEQHGLAVRF
jgi:hypothetical protein